ncbi:hypothetical protein ScPMuIL_017734 [Solemya velum]
MLCDKMIPAKCIFDSNDPKVDLFESSHVGIMEEFDNTLHADILSTFDLASVADEDSTAGLWCESCQKLQQEVKKLKEEQSLNYSTLKQKIISTDLLIKKYKAKCEDILFEKFDHTSTTFLNFVHYDEQVKKFEDGTRHLDRVQRESDTLGAQLRVSLEEIEPLKKLKISLEKEKNSRDQEVQILQDQLNASERTRQQLSELTRSTSNYKAKFEDERKELAKKLQGLETKSKTRPPIQLHIDREISKLKEECKSLKSENSQAMKKKRTLEKKLDKVLKRMESYWRVLKLNGLLPKGERKISFGSSTESDFCSQDEKFEISLMEEVSKYSVPKEETDSQEEDDHYLPEWKFSPMIPMLSPLPPSPICNEEVDASDNDDVTELASRLEDEFMSPSKEKVSLSEEAAISNLGQKKRRKKKKKKAKIHLVDKNTSPNKKSREKSNRFGVNISSNTDDDICSKRQTNKSISSNKTDDQCIFDVTLKHNIQTEDSENLKNNNKTEDNENSKSNIETEDSENLKNNNETDESENMKNDIEIENWDNLKNNFETEDSENLKNNIETEESENMKNNIETEDSENLKNNIETEDSEILKNNIETEDIENMKNDIKIKNSENMKNNFETEDSENLENNIENEKSKNMENDIEIENSDNLKNNIKTDDSENLKNNIETEDGENMKNDIEIENSDNLKNNFETEDSENLKNNIENENSKNIETENSDNLQNNIETEDSDNLKNSMETGDTESPGEVHILDILPTVDSSQPATSGSACREDSVKIRSYDSRELISEKVEHSARLQNMPQTDSPDRSKKQRTFQSNDSQDQVELDIPQSVNEKMSHLSPNQERVSNVNHQNTETVQPKNPQKIAEDEDVKYNDPTKTNSESTRVEVEIEIDTSTEIGVESTDCVEETVAPFKDSPSSCIATGMGKVKEDHKEMKTDADITVKIKEEPVTEFPPYRITRSQSVPPTNTLKGEDIVDLTKTKNILQKLAFFVNARQNGNRMKIESESSEHPRSQTRLPLRKSCSVTNYSLCEKSPVKSSSEDISREGKSSCEDICQEVKSSCDDISREVKFSREVKSSSEDIARDDGVTHEAHTVLGGGDVVSPQKKKNENIDKEQYLQMVVETTPRSKIRYSRTSSVSDQKSPNSSETEMDQRKSPRIQKTPKSISKSLAEQRVETPESVKTPQKSPRASCVELTNNFGSETNQVQNSPSGDPAKEKGVSLSCERRTKSCLDRNNKQRTAILLPTPGMRGMVRQFSTGFVPKSPFRKRISVDEFKCDILAKNIAKNKSETQKEKPNADQVDIRNNENDLNAQNTHDLCETVTTHFTCSIPNVENSTKADDSTVLSREMSASQTNMKIPFGRRTSSDLDVNFTPLRMSKDELSVTASRDDCIVPLSPEISELTFDLEPELTSSKLTQSTSSDLSVFKMSPFRVSSPISPLPLSPPLSSPPPLADPPHIAAPPTHLSGPCLFSKKLTLNSGTVRPKAVHASNQSPVDSESGFHGYKKTVPVKALSQGASSSNTHASTKRQHPVQHNRKRKSLEEVDVQEKKSCLYTGVRQGLENYLKTKTISPAELQQTLYYDRDAGQISTALTDCSIQFLLGSADDLLPEIKKACQGPQMSEPFLSDTEKRLLELLRYLLRQTSLGLSQHVVLESLWKSILSREITHSLGKMALCRVFTQLSQDEGDVEQVRAMLYQLMTWDYLPFLPLTVATVAVWPSTLKMIKPVSEANSPVVLVMNYILSVSAADGEENGQLYGCLRTICDWPENKMEAEDLIELLVKQMKELNSSELMEKSEEALFEVRKAVELLCRHKDWDWVHKHVIRLQLQPLFRQYCAKAATSGVDNSPSVKSALQLLGGLVCPWNKPPLKFIRKVITKELLVLLNRMPGDTGVQRCCVEVMLMLVPYDPTHVFASLEAWYTKHRASVSEDIVALIVSTEQMFIKKLPLGTS